LFPKFLSYHSFPKNRLSHSYLMYPLYLKSRLFPKFLSYHSYLKNPKSHPFLSYPK
jgi:hypothetical protein